MMMNNSNRYLISRNWICFIFLLYYCFNNYLLISCKFWNKCMINNSWSHHGSILNKSNSQLFFCTIIHILILNWLISWSKLFFAKNQIISIKVNLWSTIYIIGLWIKITLIANNNKIISINNILHLIFCIYTTVFSF